MKTKTHPFLIIFLLISVSVFSAPLSGIYTIGGSSPSYASFTTAVTDVTAKGVSGPVTFNVRTGTYTESPITISNITGASATNTITFQSESGVTSDVTLHTEITLDAANFITITHITMTYNGILINLINKGNNITITNNVLTGPVVSAFGTDVIQAIGFTGSNLNISNNTINNGSEGICLYGTDNSPQNIIINATIKNNTIQNFYGWGICANNQKGTLIEGNIISTAPTTGYGSIPIYIQSIMYPICVVKNKITLTGPNSGIAAMYIVNNHPASISDASTIANNMISVQNGNGLLAINNDYFNFYYNTVYIISYGTCFNVYGGSTGNVLADNIFYQGSGQTAISVSPPAAVSSCDYNDIYSTSSSFGSWNGSTCSNFASWKSTSGMDAHSSSLVPSFISSTNLHLTNYAAMQFGTPIVSVPDDIDGDSRNNIPAVGVDDNGATYTGPTNLCCSCGAQIAAAFTANQTSVCAGGSVTFTDQSIGASAWKWSFTGGVPDTSSSQNPTVAYDTAGIYGVKLLVSSTAGSDSLTKTAYITVIALPATGTLSAQPDTLCFGDSSMLSVTGSGGSIQWQSSITGNNFANISAANNATYNTPPLSQTTGYRLIVTNGNCSDTSAALPVLVNPNPTPPVLSAPDSLICASDSALITTSGSYSSYLWNNSDNRSYTYADVAGGYWVTVTDANGCTAVSNHQNISVYPVTSVSIVVSGDTLSSFGGVSYQWYLNDTVIPNATNPVYIAIQPGNYAVQVTDTKGCKALSSNTYVVITGITQPGVYGGLNIYPDPFTNSIYIDNTPGIKIRQVEIYDALGRVVLLRKYVDAPVNPVMEVSALSGGAYYLRIKTDENEFIKKLIK